MLFYLVATVAIYSKTHMQNTWKNNKILGRNIQLHIKI